MSAPGRNEAKESIDACSELSEAEKYLALMECSDQTVLEIVVALPVAERVKYIRRLIASVLKRPSGGESSVTLTVSATDPTVRFDSFLAALDASEVLPIPFAPHRHYIPLVQQEGHPIQPVIFGKAMDGTRIFVRPCYTALWKFIQQQRDDYIDNQPVTGGVVITGNSGVGMSIFLAYIIKQLRSLPKPPTIVYDKLTSNKCYVMRPGSSHVESYTEPPSSISEDQRVVYLVDLGPSMRQLLECSAFTIVIGDPHTKGQKDVRHWNKFMEYTPVRYMPCWNESELEVCRRVTRPSADEQKKDQLKGTCLLPAMSSETLAQRYALFGGIARVVLASSTLSDLKECLDRALGSCDLDTVAKYPGPDLERLPMDSSWIFHYKVNPDSFQLDGIDFASKPILEQVWNRYSDNHDQVMRFLNVTSRMSSAWNGVRWNLFQLLAHEHLQKGGTFVAHKLVADSKNDQAQRVQDSTPSTLTLPKSSSVRSVADAAAIAHLTAGEYGQLSKANFQTIDAVIRPNCLFQTTVSQSHTVNIDELIAAVNALQLEPDEPIRFYFVAPPEQFETFQFDTLTASDTSSSLTIANVPDAIEYWVLQMYPQVEQAEPESVIITSKRKDMASSTSPPPSPKMSKTY